MNKPVRVLHVIGGMNRGGAETIIMNLYREIDRSKIQFDFAVHTMKKCAYDDEITDLGGIIYRFPKFNGTNIIPYSKAWHYFWKSDKEHNIVHGHIGSSAAIYLYIAKKYGIYTIAHSHSTGILQNAHDFLWKLFSYPTRYIADSFFACSQLAGIKRFGKRFNGNKTNNYILPNAIKIEKYVFCSKIRQKIRNEFDIDNSIVYGHVGRFTHAKNHVFLIELFHELYKLNPNSKLFLVGDGELRGLIEKKISDLGLSNAVIITGVVDNVNEYLQAFDIFMFPSLYEGLPTTVIEAQASGLPSLLSDTITREICISPLVNFMSLKDPLENWIIAIKNLENIDRVNMKKCIVEKGYEISTVGKWLENFYLSKV